MKIGIIGPIWLNIPPEKYGGTEQVVYNLTQGLVANGHEVTLFGPQTSHVNAKLFPTVKSPLRERMIPWTNLCYNLYHITQAFDNAHKFDILHVHLNKSQDYISLPFTLYSPTPVLFTFHCQLPSLVYHPDHYQILMKYAKLPYTSISNSQRANLPLNFIATVYNALRIEEYPFSEKAADYFVWLGRIDPKKGTKEAILAAKKAGVKLYVLGTVEKSLPEKLSYYENEVKPFIDNKQIVWFGEVSVEHKAKLLGQAKGLLNPILWEEPFGLVMAEAQATGTPVISFKKGAAPEVIVDGQTGFLVETIDEMVEKMKIIDSIDRRTCRKHIEEKFLIPTMINEYEQAYQTAQKNWITDIIQEKKHIELQKIQPLAI